MITKINLNDKFGLFNDHWRPKVVAALNGQEVKIIKVKGEFPWHRHDHEDELFLVVRGQLTMQFRDKQEVLGPGEFIVVPRGVEHRPVATGETSIMLFEPATTLNTGNLQNERTRAKLERL